MIKALEIGFAGPLSLSEIDGARGPLRCPRAYLDKVQVRSVLLEEVGSECALGDGHDDEAVATQTLWPESDVDRRMS